MSKPSSKDLQWTRTRYTLVEILRKCSLPIILQNSDYKQVVLWVDQIFTSGALCARGKKDHFLLVPHNSPLLQKLHIYKDPNLKSLEDALDRKCFPFRVTSHGQVTYLMENGIEGRLFDKLTIESLTSVDYLLACKLTLESDATKPQLEALPISSKNKFHIATGYKKTEFEWENFKSLVKGKIEELMVFHPKTISKVVFQFDSNPLNSHTPLFPRCVSFAIKEITDEQESDVPTQPLVASLAKETQQSPNAKYEGPAMAASIKGDTTEQQKDTSVHKEVKKKHKKDGHHKKNQRKQIPQEKEQKATEPMLSFSEQINQKALLIGQSNDKRISQDSHPSTFGSNISQTKVEAPHKDVSGMAAKLESKFKDEKMQMLKPLQSSRLEEQKVLESLVDVATSKIAKTPAPTPIVMPTNVVSYPSGNTPNIVHKNPTPTPAVKTRPVSTPTAVTPTQTAKAAPKVAAKPFARQKLVPKSSESTKRHSEPLSTSNPVEIPTRPLSEIISTLNASGGGIMGINQSKPQRMSLCLDQSNSPPWEAFNARSQAGGISTKQGKNERKPPDVKQKPVKPPNLNLKTLLNESTGKCDIPQSPGKDARKSAIVSPTIANIIGRLSVDGEPMIPMAADNGFSVPSGGKVKIPGKNQNPNEHIYDEIREPVFDAKKSTVTSPKETETKNYVAIVKRNENQDNDVLSKLEIPIDPYSGAYVNVQSYE